MSKVLSIFGATGAQGGALLSHVLSSPRLSKLYRVRAITRDVSKPAAKKLEQQSVEVVQVYGFLLGSSVIRRPTDPCLGRHGRS